MSEVLVGSAYWLAQLRYEQFTEGVGIVEQQVKRLQALSQQPIAFQAQLGAGAGAGAASNPASAAASSVGAAASVAPAAAANAAALSREALAAGDAARALELMDQALGKTSADTKTTADTSLAATRAEASLAVALGDRTRAIELLEAALAGQAERTTAVIAAERQLATIENQAITASTREADQAIRVAQAQARAAISTKDYAGALEILNTARAQNAGGSAGVVASLEAQIAQTEAAGTVTGALGRELGGLVSPLALATAGAAAAATVFRSFGDALEFEGKLTEERTAFGGILGDFQLGNAVLDEATRRTRAYGFTTKETTDAFRDLAPIIRESTSSTKDQSEALARISVLQPDKPVDALKNAIEGIKTGRFRELSKELGLTTIEQQQLKLSTDQGKDAFIALNEVLDRHGITLDVAKERTQGLAGAERARAQAEEDLKRAQAGASAGIGVTLTQLETVALRGLTFQLSSNADLQRQIQAEQQTTAITVAQTTHAIDEERRAIGETQIAMQQQSVSLAQNGGAYNAYAQAANATGVANQAAATQVQFFAQAAQVSAQASAVDAAAKEAQQAKTALVNAETNKAADAFLALNPTMSATQAYAAAVAQGLGVVTAQVIAFRIEANQAKQDLAGLATVDPNAQLKAGLSALRSGSATTANEISDANVRVLNRDAAARAQAAKDAASLLDSEIGLAGAKKDTAKQIDLLRQKQSQLDRTTVAGQAQYNDIQAQIINIQTQSGKTRVDRAASTALQLQNVEENSGLQLARIQRENLERLRHQQEEFDVRRSRSEEDYQEKRISLLAHGQRAQAAELEKDHAKDVRRAQEDFDRQKRDTLRNNQEALGDTTNRADLRQQQIGNRAALRGVRAAGGVDLGQAPPQLTGGGAATAQAAAMRVIQIMFSATVQMDGHEVGKLIYEGGLRTQIDDDLAVALAQAGIPGAGQNAVGGVG